MCVCVWGEGSNKNNKINCFSYLKANIKPINVKNATTMTVITIRQSVLFMHFSPLNPQIGSALGGFPPAHIIGRFSL